MYVSGVLGDRVMENKSTFLVLHYMREILPLKARKYKLSQFKKYIYSLVQMLITPTIKI